LLKLIGILLVATIVLLAVSLRRRNSARGAAELARSRRLAILALAICPLVVMTGTHMMWRKGLLQRAGMTSELQAIAVILGLWGIASGSIQLWGSNRQREKMEEIAGSISTRSVGPFPKHLDNITEVVNHSHRSLLIMADCVDYGSFWAPEAHQRLNDAILNALGRKVVVQLVVCTDPAHITRVCRYWGESFEGIRRTSEFNHYFDVNSGDQVPQDQEQFKDLMTRSQQATAFTLNKKGAKIFLNARTEDSKKGTEETPLFLWSADAEDAVFLFADAAVEIRGLAFRTRDSKLIELLESSFTRKLKDSDQWVPVMSGSLAPVLSGVPKQG
jgi:hypothetical protein